jgi:DNA repair exonuclease SbcCD nuclease subunit
MKGIITADWHISGTPPLCRLETEEEWLELQKNCIEEILKLAKSKECPVYIVGDICNRAVISEAAKNMLFEIFNKYEAVKKIIMPGNHDLPYHLYSLVERSSYGLLEKICDSIWDYEDIQAAPFGLDKDKKYQKENAKILCTHQLVSPTPLPGAKTPEELIEEFPGFKYIFTGDYHHAFAVAGETQIYNPGCINRQTADMSDYQPKVLWIDIEANVAKWFDLNTDIENGRITIEYVEVQKERDTRIASFIEKIGTKKNKTFDFLTNLKQRAASLPKEEKKVELQILKIIGDKENE